MYSIKFAVLPCIMFVRLREKMSKIVKKNTGCDLQVVYEHQQRESLRFISLFAGKMIIHSVCVCIALDASSMCMVVDVHGCACAWL